MTASQYGNALRHWWWLVAVGTALGALVGFLLVGTPAPRYAAYATVSVSSAQSSSGNPSDAYTATLLAQQRVLTYASIAENPSLVSELAGSTSMTVEEVTDALTITVPANTTVVAIRYIDTDPDRAASAAQSTAERVVGIVQVGERRIGLPPLLRPRIVAPAESATELAQTAPWRNPVVASLAGLLIGLAAAVAATRRDRRLRLPSSVADDVGAPVLGSLPRRASEQDRGSTLVRELRAEVLLQHGRTSGGIRVAVTAPADTRAVGRVALALATSLADADVRVLLVEAELEAGTLAEDLGIDPGSAGLASFLEGTAPRGDVVRTSPGGDVDVVVGGSATTDPSDLLQSPALAGVLEDAASRYDVTVVAAPPAGRGVEAAAVAAHCDLTVLVVTRGRTRRPDLRASVTHLRRAGADVTSTVLIT